MTWKKKQLCLLTPHCRFDKPEQIISVKSPTNIPNKLVDSNDGEREERPNILEHHNKPISSDGDNGKVTSTDFGRTTPENLHHFTTTGKSDIDKRTVADDNTSMMPT